MNRSWSQAKSRRWIIAKPQRGHDLSVGPRRPLPSGSAMGDNGTRTRRVVFGRFFRGLCMQAIRVTQTLASETLHLPELRPLIGKQVEIIVLADEPSPGTSMPATDEALRYPLRGSV